MIKAGAAGQLLYELPGKLRYMKKIHGFLGEPLTLAKAAARIEAQLGRREESFLKLVDRGIYAVPDSPFRGLLVGAGIELEDFRRLLEQAGLQGALERLHDAGVFLTYEETRGLVPVHRNGVELQIAPADLDNRLLVRDFEVRSSGSRSSGSRSFTDLSLLTHESAYYLLLLHAHGVSGRPIGIWRLMPPSFSGFNALLRYTKAGNAPSKWFSQVTPRPGLEGLKAAALVRYTAAVARTRGYRFPAPVFAPQDEAVKVAEWLAEMTAAGTPALLDTTASGATRVSIAAKAKGLDISGSAFRTGGEPLTPAKGRMIAAAGARAINGYAASELGVAGLGCAAGSTLDDLHLVTDKFAVIQREKRLDSSGASVPALIYTTLLLDCRKVMINVESGDYGTLEERECGCSLGELGLKVHLTGLHGYDKLTSEGVTFMGSELYRLLEEELPARFGGEATDYQLAEEEDSQGIPKVSIVVAPGVGEVDADAVIAVVLQALRREDSTGRGSIMADQWRQSATLQIVRRDPYVSGSRKIMPLHIVRSASPDPASVMESHSAGLR